VDASWVQAGWRRGIRWRADGVIEIVPHPHREGTEQSQCDSIGGGIYLCIRMN